MRPLVGLLLATTLLASPALAEDVPLGRLFFTPEQRMTLDRRRQYQQAERQVSAGAGTITVNGLVRRSDGKITTWVNGEAVDNEKRSPGEPSARDVVVGERLNQATGERQDLLQGGEIKITPARPK